MGLFGGDTNATKNSRLLGYRVQTSISGSALKIVFGTNRIPANVIWTGDWKAHKAGGKAGKGKSGSNYTYTMAAIAALCSGPITGVVAVWADQVKNGQADTSWLYPNSVADLGLTIINGALGQAPWSYVASNHPDQALGYSEVAYAAKEDWDLGSAGVMPNYSYEVAGFDSNGPNGDALCSQVIFRLLTDPLIGAGFQTTEVDVSEAEAYCTANGLYISPVLDQQKAASEWINELLLIANAEAVWSAGILKLKSRGDENLAPVMDLTDDDFLDAEEPVRISRPNPRDASNSVKINWTNRGNQYNSEPLEQQDQRMIDFYGFRPSSAVDALGITTADVAQRVANVQLKRNIAFRAKYKFKLGFEHILLEPMDIVTLTSQTGNQSYQGLNRKPVRLLSISEDEGGFLDCEAEDVIPGTGTPTIAAVQVGGSYTTPATVIPGPVIPPIFYEGTREMRQLLYGTPYALLIALAGGPNWAGCTVYRSWDNITYEAVGRQTGSTPMGVLSGGLASAADPDAGNTLAVNLFESGGELQSVTLADADNFKTLSVIGGGATSELVSFETATLTGTNAYNLTYLRRGVYQSPIASHSAGDNYFLVKNAFVWIYQSQDVGQTIYFKFASFNASGATQEQLADVTAFSYTLTGGLSGVKTIIADYTLEPSDVGLNVDTTAGNITITIPAALATVNTTTVISKISADTNKVITAGATISGQASMTLAVEYDSITIESTKQGWVLVASTPRFMENIVPTGAMDGVNTTFTLPVAPNPPASLRLVLSGVEQLTTRNYTLSGLTITFVSVTALPNATDDLRASFRY